MLRHGKKVTLQGALMHGKKWLSEGYIQSEDCRGRDTSGHRKIVNGQGYLLSGPQKEGHVGVQKESN